MPRLIRNLTATAIATGAILAFVPAGPALAGPASTASGRHQTPLAQSVDRQIRALPHPQLRRACAGGRLDVSEFARTTAGGHRVVVAGVTCRGATAASPFEVSAYRWRAGKVVRQAYLTRGGSFRRDGGKTWVVATNFVTRGTKVTIRYAGYDGNDPMCCPSKLYKRAERLTASGVKPGPLVRTR